MRYSRDTIFSEAVCPESANRNAIERQLLYLDLPPEGRLRNAAAALL